MIYLYLKLILTGISSFKGEMQLPYSPVIFIPNDLPFTIQFHEKIL